MNSDVGVFNKVFPKGYIVVVLSSIFQAGVSLRKKSDNEFENKISYRLCRGLIKIPEFRDGPLDIRPQTGILSVNDDTDNLEGSTDLLVSCGHGHEVYFVIEAKRLRVRSPNGRLDSGNDKYVNDGMMRFVSGQYSPFMKEGAMLGYVFDGKIDKVRTGIDRYVKNHAEKLKLMKPKRFVRSKILPDEPVDETLHDLENRYFTIYHIFLSV